MSKANPHPFIYMNPLSRNPGSAPGVLVLAGYLGGKDHFHMSGLIDSN